MNLLGLRQNSDIGLAGGPDSQRLECPALFPAPVVVWRRSTAPDVTKAIAVSFGPRWSFRESRNDSLWSSNTPGAVPCDDVLSFSDMCPSGRRPARGVLISEE